MLNSFQMVTVMLGMMVLAVALPMMFNPKRMASLMKEAINSQGYLLLAGMANLIFAIVVLGQYYEISADWRTVMSVMGWMALIKGLTILWFPGILKATTKPFMKSLSLMVLGGFFCLVLGTGLMYLGLCVYWA